MVIALFKVYKSTITRGTARSNMKVSIFGGKILSANSDPSIAF